MQSSPGTSASALKSPPYLENTLPGSSFGDLGWSDLFNWDSSPPSDSSYRHSPVSTPSPLLVPAPHPPEPFPFGSPCRGSRWTENVVQTPRKCDTGCSCMSEPACYNSALELASELRRAATVLSRSLNHCYGYPCTLGTKISELESLTMYVAHTTCNGTQFTLIVQECPPHRSRLSRCFGRIRGPCTGSWGIPAGYHCAIWGTAA